LTNCQAAGYDDGMWILVIVGSLVGLVVVMAAIGLALPRDHVAARAAVLARSPEDVWRVISNIDDYPRWRHGVKAIERLSQSEFRERSSNGVIRYEVVEDRPREVRITRIADPKLPFGGRWIFELAGEGTGTRLTITEDGFVKNPVFRFLSRTVFSTTATLERFLTDLGRHLGVAAAVEVALPSSRARGVERR
jgi:hypothetical protein